MLCNMCGLEMNLRHSFNEYHGLKASVTGGYLSTPGNGYGALDDMSTYDFNLCEFCLDYLFSNFKIPPKVYERLITNSEEKFRPAGQRVIEDDWRKDKEEFFKEYEKRNLARKNLISITWKLPK